MSAWKAANESLNCSIIAEGVKTFARSSIIPQLTPSNHHHHHHHRAEDNVGDKLQTIRPIVGRAINIALGYARHNFPPGLERLRRCRSPNSETYTCCLCSSATGLSSPTSNERLSIDLSLRLRLGEFLQPRHLYGRRGDVTYLIAIGA